MTNIIKKAKEAYAENPVGVIAAGGAAATYVATTAYVVGKHW